MTKVIRRRPPAIVTRSVLAVALVVACLVVPAAPAAAHPVLSPHPTCAGSRVGDYHLYSEETTLSLFVYYSSAGGGTNCAWVQKEVNTGGRGKVELMYISIARCATNNPNNCGTLSGRNTDEGGFKYYAGPVTTSSTANRCIVIDVAYRNFSTVTRGPFHCG